MDITCYLNKDQPVSTHLAVTYLKKVARVGPHQSHHQKRISGKKAIFPRRYLHLWDWVRAPSHPQDLQMHTRNIASFAYMHPSLLPMLQPVKSNHHSGSGKNWILQGKKFNNKRNIEPSIFHQALEVSRHKPLYTYEYRDQILNRMESIEELSRFESASEVEKGMPEEDEACDQIILLPLTNKDQWWCLLLSVEFQCPEYNSAAHPYQHKSIILEWIAMIDVKFSPWEKTGLLLPDNPEFESCRTKSRDYYVDNMLHFLTCEISLHINNKAWWLSKHVGQC